MMLRRIVRLAAVVIPLIFTLTLSTVISPVSAATNPLTLPAGFEDTMAYGGLLAPRAFTFTPDGRVLALERGSQNSNDSNLASIRVFKNGALLPARAYTVNTCGDSERGLLGIAVDPNFATNGYIYIYYTRQATTGQACAHNTFTNGIATGPRNRVSRLTMSGDTVIPGSERVYIDSIITDIGYHNAGDLRFGSDGYLYISTGDGGQSWTSQNLGTLNGKILRILPTPGEAGGYTTNGNPYNTAAGARHCYDIPPGTITGVCKEIYASGLRNPFRFTIQPAMAGIPGSGSPFVGDVGGGAWEEIDQIRAGGNYGHPEREGFCSGGVVCSPPYQTTTFDNPVSAYSHVNINANYDSAVIGGDFYTGTAGWPAAYNNNYFYADVVRGFVRRLSYNATTSTWNAVAGDFGSNGSSIIGLKRGPDGNLYYLTFVSEIDRIDGIRRIRYTSSQNQSPVAQISSDKQSGPLNTVYNLSAAGSYDPDANNPLTYVWNFGDGTSTTTTTPTVSKTYTTVGNKTVTLTVRDSGTPMATSTPVTLVIYAGNAAPTGQIVLTNLTDNSRTASSTFYGGDVWSYAVANATDDEPLPADAFTWEVVFHHSTHTHPFLPYLVGANGQFTIPNTGELDPIVWYRVYLYITDSRGQRTTVVKDINPITSNLTFNTSPAGGQVTIEGAIFPAPRTITRVVGMRFSIDVPSPQLIGSSNYGFASWSQGGSKLQTITVPPTDTTYTASLNLFVPTATPIPSTSLWTNSVPPSVTDYNGTQPLEMGVKFQTSVNALVTGLRFYKGVNNTGTHTGRLWSSSGALIASAVFTNESASGWQTVTFPTPIAINANTVYVASYYSPTGRFSYTANYFANSGVTNGILTAPSSGSVGGNGVYMMGPNGTFPTVPGHNYWVDVQVIPGGAGATPMPTPTPTPIPPASLWTTSTVPSGVEYNGTAPIELGVKFQTSVNAQVTGLRFYKGVTNTGTHIGRLWSSSGALIATAVFTSETASGWQTVTFPNPVSISANTVYIASYHSPTGKFTYTANYFSSARTSGILTAPSSTSVGGNGVFMPGPSGTFPSAAGHNYWVDVLVKAGGSGATPVPTNTPVPTATRTPTPIPTSTPVGMNTLWPTSATPAVPDVNGTAPIELGVKFRTSVNALVTGIRFYKGASNTGTHTGHLWTSNGTLLGTATFTNETASGWQTVTFPNPIAINANTVYVASYFSPTGRFSYTGNYFNSVVTSGILTAPDTTTAGGNGVFTRGTNGSFPVSSSGANNFWVDVMVLPNGAGSTPVPTNTANPPTLTPPPAASPTPNSGGSTTVTVNIDSGVNDVNEVSGSMDATNSALWIGSAGTTSSYTGLRFGSVNIPKGATITSAQLQFYSVNQQWISISLSVAGEASGNSAAFAANALPSQRTLTTARVAHASDEGWSADTWYTFADVKTIVQELINLGSWQTGNPLTLILQGNGGWGRKYIRAIEGGSAGAARLVITYTN